MIRKSYTKSGKSCRVTFKVKVKPEELTPETAVLLGEFNEWNPESHPLKKRKDGSFSTTLSLDAGREYRFRYLLDGAHWLNDTEADGYAFNSFGSRDCLVEI